MRTAVQRNHSRFMDHLLKDRHESWALNDLLSVAVDHWENRSCDAACDATNVVTEILPRCGLWIVVACAFGNSPRSCFGQNVGSSAVGWIHDKRSLLAWPSCALAPVTRRASAHASILGDEFLFVVIGLARKSLLSVGQFLFRVIEPVAKLGRPIKGRADAVIARPCAL